MDAMIKTLIFDLGGVLIPFDSTRSFVAMEPFCDYSAEQIPAMLRQTDLVRRFETGLIGSQEFASQLSALLGLRVNYQEFCSLWTKPFLPEALAPPEMLEKLHRRYRLIALSNTNPIHFEAVQRIYPFLAHFDDFVLSYKVGCLKPAALIYEEALRRAGCLPAECLYIDDSESYVAAAAGLGIKAEQFRDHASLAEVLADHGVVSGEAI